MPTPILLKNGIFWTGNKTNPYAEEVRCSDGIIDKVGTGFTSEATQTIGIDLRGHFAMPGFIDAHTHFRIGGAMMNRLDLRKVQSAPDLARAVKERSGKHPKDKWMLGGNWDHESWKSRTLPRKEMIDTFTSSFPVFLDRVDTHMALVNSRALEAAGIGRDTPDPPGGVIMRDDSGEPTGIVKDAAREMVLGMIPEPPLDQLVRDAREAMRLAGSLGVTSVSDIGPQRDLNAYMHLHLKGELTVRINMMLPIDNYRLLIEQGITAEGRPSGNEWIKLGAVKAFADGSLGAGTAWLFEPYEDELASYGLPTAMFSSGELETCALDADMNRIQLAIHAIGDKAVAGVLDIFEKITGENQGWDRRFRVEHAQHIRAEDFARFAKLKVIASIQPYHCIDDGRWAENKIGARRAKSAFAFRRLIDEGVALAFGTDWPVAPLNPIMGIYAAVTRATTGGENPAGWVPEQKITVEEALRAYTYGSAYASFDEDRKGTLEPGKLADVVVLSRNPFDVAPEELKDIKVVMTIVGGRVVYSDGTLYEEVNGGNPSA